MKIYHPIQELEATGVVRAATSLRQGGVSQAPYASLNLAEHVEDCPKAVATNRQIFFAQTGVKKLVYCHQIHSVRVVEAESVADTRETADAIICAKSGNAIGVFTADCVPVFILDTATPAIGIAHAGWRGTLANIAVHTLARMKAAFGTNAADCLIHLGISIKKCCYTVSAELIAQFVENFGSSVHEETNLDLQAANVIQLTAIGVPPSAISVSPFCTACCTENFYSHRAEGGRTGRMLSFIELTDGNCA